MRQSEVRDFYEEWMQKVSTLTNQDESRHSFEKFIYLYIIYNALYSRATTSLKYKGITFASREKEQAVDNVIKFFDGNSQQCGENLIDFLRRRNDVNVEAIKDFNHGFDIYSLRKYIPEEAKKNNIELRDKLASSSTDKQAEGILELIYRVRCNLFHGEKRFNPRQDTFLSPIVEILQSIVKELYTKLNDPEHPYYMDDSGYKTYLEQLEEQPNNKTEYKRLLESLQNSPIDLEILEKIRAVGRLAGYDPNKVNKDIEKLSKQPKSKSK